MEGVDIAPQALPHMSVARGRICGVPMLLFRVSFTGELGFEVNVPADFGPAVWEAICAAGQQHGMTPYGTETMHVLRAEKGYIIVGQDTDGTVTPDDAGPRLGDRQDQAGLRRQALAAASGDDARRPQATRGPDHLPTRRWCSRKARRSWRSRARRCRRARIGHVTSSYHSAVLGRSIALATRRRRPRAHGPDALRADCRAAMCRCR